ncbi:hypothetical protein QYF61_018737 [Mycteria americana]|uniref:Storkhead-box protein 1 n=1 Tax=Mycteria americana TaxID=33587 RepID=A0AAN7RW44_MYCAM|nr:hypothetical protein QYF61_018737 [Mycteria americana]
MPRRAERCLQIAPHSLAIVLGAAAGGRPGGGGGGGEGPAAELGRHRIGYEIFADFKRENMQHFWDRRATAAVAETFFLGWIDEQVLLVQGKEEHLEVLRQGWARRSLKPPSGFHIKCLGRCPRSRRGVSPPRAGSRRRGERGGGGPAELPPERPRPAGSGAGGKGGALPAAGFAPPKRVGAEGASRERSGGVTGMRCK